MLEVKQVQQWQRVNEKLFRDNTKSTQVFAGIRVERDRAEKQAEHKAETM